MKTEEANLNINDLAILRGYGIFDFFRLVDNKPLFFEDHLNRFYRSADIAQLPIPFSEMELKGQIFDLISKNNLPISGIRIVLTGGYSDDGYSIGVPNLMITQERISFPDEKKYTNGVNIITRNFQRELPEVKTIGYMTGIWMKPEIRKQNAFDVLYINNCKVHELTRSNIFMVTSEGRVVTPANNILKGITRKNVLKVAYPNYEVEERDISLDEILNAQEVFLTGTTKKILPVVQIDGNKIGDGKPGKVTIQLLQLFNELVSS